MGANANDKEFDIIIFGATGFTGQYVIEELAYSSASKNIKWAIAGRSTEKLKKSLSLVQGYLGERINIQEVTVIEADARNATSLNNMCKRAKLILNCAGPYKQYGEHVVQACIRNGTHHVDLSGEMTFLETMQMKYFDEARAKNVYIVGPCGFDSIVSDYGTSLMKENFKGDLNSVEYYMEFHFGPSGLIYKNVSFLSEIFGFNELLKRKYDELLREKLFKKDLPKNKYAISRRMPLFHSTDVKGWYLWHFGPDDRVIRRSQMFRYEYLSDRPVQSYGYVRAASFIYGLVLLFLIAMIAFTSLFSFGRYLLDKYPEYFSGGLFCSDGPTRQQIMEASVTITFIGKGWKDELLDANDQHNTKPDTTFKLTMIGPEAGYPMTAMCMVQSGLTILEEENKMPLMGGVLTPGVAFEKTSLRQRLESRGITFTFETC